MSQSSESKLLDNKEVTTKDSPKVEDNINNEQQINNQFLNERLMRRLMNDNKEITCLLLFKLIESVGFKLMNQEDKEIDFERNSSLSYHFDRNYLLHLAQLIVACSLYKNLCLVDYAELRTLITYFPLCYNQLYKLRESQSLMSNSINVHLIEKLVDEIEEYLEEYMRIMVNKNQDMYFVGDQELIEKFNKLRIAHRNKMNSTHYNSRNSYRLVLPTVSVNPDDVDKMIVNNKLKNSSCTTIINIILSLDFVKNYDKSCDIKSKLCNLDSESLLTLLEVMKELSKVYKITQQITCILDLIMTFEYFNLLNVLKWIKKQTKLKRTSHITLENTDLNLMKKLNKDDKVFFIDTLNGSEETCHLSDSLLLFLDYFQKELDSCVYEFNKYYDNMCSISQFLKGFSSCLDTILENMKTINYKLVRDYMINKLAKYITYYDNIMLLLNNYNNDSSLSSPSSSTEQDSYN